MQYDPGPQRAPQDPPYHSVTKVQCDWIKHPSNTIHELSNLLTDVLDQVERSQPSGTTRWQPASPHSDLQSLFKGLSATLPAHLPLLQALAHTPAERLKATALEALDTHPPEFARALYHCLRQQGACHHTLEGLRHDTLRIPAKALQSLLIRHIHWALNI